MNVKDLLYYNGFGGFEKDSLSYVISTEENTTPVPWSHIIANENFGTIVTSDGGGYTWHGNGRENKITRWANDAVTNKPSESLYIKINGKRIKCMPRNDLKNYKIKFGFGVAEYIFENDEIVSILTVYVPRNRKEKIYNLKLRNKQERVAKISILLCVEPVLGVSREYTKKHLKFSPLSKGILIKNSYRELYQNDLVIVDSEDECLKTVKNKKVFLKVKRNLLPDEEENVNFRIGIQESIEELNMGKETGENLLLDVEKDLEEIKKFWHSESIRPLLHPLPSSYQHLDCDKTRNLYPHPQKFLQKPRSY